MRGEKESFERVASEARPLKLTFFVGRSPRNSLVEAPMVKGKTPPEIVPDAGAGGLRGGRGAVGPAAAGAVPKAPSAPSAARRGKAELKAARDGSGSDHKERPRHRARATRSRLWRRPMVMAVCRCNDVNVKLFILLSENLGVLDCGSLDLQ